MAVEAKALVFHVLALAQQRGLQTIFDGGLASFLVVRRKWDETNVKLKFGSHLNKVLTEWSLDNFRSDTNLVKSNGVCWKKKSESKVQPVAKFSCRP